MAEPLPPVAEPDKTTPVLEIVEQSEEWVLIAFGGEEEYPLSEEEVNLFMQGQEHLEDGFAPEDCTVGYYFYTYYVGEGTPLPTTIIFRPEPYENSWVVKQYINDSWVTCPTAVNPDSTITVDLESAPTAMAYINLLGEWTFKETITQPELGDYELKFSSDNKDYTSINCEEMEGGGFTLTYDGLEGYDSDKGWDNQALRTINITDASLLDGEIFYSWLKANATKSAGGGKLI